MSSRYDFQARVQRSERWRFSQAASQLLKVLPGLLLALQGLLLALPGNLKHNIFTPIVLLYLSSEIPVTPNASRNALLRSDTLLKLPHLSLHSNCLRPSWRLPVTEIHWQKTFPSRRIGCIRVESLCQSRHRHPGGRPLRTQWQHHVSRCRSPSNDSSAIASCSVGILLWTNTVVL